MPARFRIELEEYAQLGGILLRFLRRHIPYTF